MKLSFKINKPADLILNYLTDMEKFASVHPVITKISRTGEDTFQVHETMKMGLIPVSFTYPATMEYKPKDNTVILHAVVMKMTRIDMTFAVTADNGFSLVEETILIKSPLPITSFMQKVFRKQHGLLFKNIESLKT